jgi:hypothetical protein
VYMQKSTGGVGGDQRSTAAAGQVSLKPGPSSDPLFLSGHRSTVDVGIFAVDIGCNNPLGINFRGRT